MGHFGVNKCSQNLKVALLNFSNPESGTFWASVSGQKALFGVNLVSQNGQFLDLGEQWVLLAL